MPRPPKLTPDSIVESLLEIRFSSDDVPEIIVGKLAAIAAWNAFPVQQLPAAQMPAMLRRVDPNLAYMPTLERKSEDGKVIIRFGERVLSYHRVAPYPTWPVFGSELSRTIATIFDAGLLNFRINRFGLRYINAFTSDKHGIDGVNDLNLHIDLGTERLTHPFVLAVKRAFQADIEGDIRIAAKELILNPEPPDQTAFLDLDFHSHDNFACTEISVAQDWLTRAHDEMEKVFLNLLTPATKDRLLEK